MLEVGTKVILGIRGYYEQVGEVIDVSSYAYIIETKEDMYTIPTKDLGITYSINEQEESFNPKAYGNYSMQRIEKIELFNELKQLGIIKGTEKEYKRLTVKQMKTKKDGDNMNKLNQYKQVAHFIQANDNNSDILDVFAELKQGQFDAEVFESICINIVSEWDEEDKEVIEHLNIMKGWE